MESRVDCYMVSDLWKESDGCLFIDYLVSDNNNSLRSHLKHTGNGIKFPEGVPKPNFLADPSHRIKTIYSPIHKIITNTKDPSKYKK